MTNIFKRMFRAKRLTYIWKDCFATNVKNIKIINFIEHSIDFETNVKLVRDTLFKYIQKKKKFANKIFSKFENVNIIIRQSNEWKTRIKFSLKKKKSELLKMIYNFIFVNHFIIKSAYFMHHLEKIIVILIKSEYFVYFCSNAANDYWIISIKQRNRNKINFLISND